MGDRLLYAVAVVVRSPGDGPDRWRGALRRLGWYVREVEPGQDDDLIAGIVRGERIAGRRFAAITLLSGDGGLVEAVQEARTAGSHVTVAAWPVTLAARLRETADAVEELTVNELWIRDDQSAEDQGGQMCER